MSRWQMHKLGFVNFWLYDQEEFRIDGGHFLLRGQNGAGKSVTTQSFIPFILDGDRRPERLDPFGTKDKKMDYYLLGEDRDDATGYLYLEFKKPDLERYITIGVGMRAVRGKGIDFWGFCLRDGRRIGPGGVELVEHIGNTMIPLTRLKLKNLLNSPEDWADSPRTYRELVNERIFGFRDIRQYEQLVNLLIKVRAPKLQKENVRPSELKRILNDSLQVLTDEDLSAMVSTMERMDELESEVKRFRDAKKDAESVCSEMDRYNQYMLGKKGAAYLESRSKTRSSRKKLRDTEEQIQQTKERLEELEETSRDAARRIQEARDRKSALGEDDLAKMQEELHAVEQQIEHYQGRESEEQRSLDDILKNLREEERKLRDRTQKAKDTEAALRSGLKKLNRQNEALLLGDEHRDYVRDIPLLWEKASGRTVQQALDRRRKIIREMKGLLQQIDVAQAAYDDACKAADEADKRQRQAANEKEDAQDGTVQQRDQLLEDFQKQLSENEEFKLDEDQWQLVQRKIVQYKSASDWTPIRELLESQKAQAESRLNREQFRLRHEADQQEKAVNQLNQELIQAKNEPDRKPKRNPRTEEAREQLVQRGIPHAALYDAVDFAPGMEQAEKDLLEAQLTDAGLLDALLVPEEYWDAVQDLYEAYPDRFLRPGPGAGAAAGAGDGAGAGAGAAADPLARLVPDGDKLPHALIQRCLNSISQSDPEASTALLPDGWYRNGILCGRSVAEETAGYVGATARKEARERLIRELTDKLREASEELQRLEDSLDAVLKRLGKLGLEWKTLPSPAGLDKALDTLRQKTMALEAADRELALCRGREADASKKVGNLKSEFAVQSVDLPYKEDLSHYEEAEDAAEEYERILRNMMEQQGDLGRIHEAMEESDFQIGQWQEQAGSRKRSLQSAIDQRGQAEHKAKVLRETLDNPENRNRAQQIMELIQIMDEQQKRKETADQEHARQEERASHGQEELVRCQEELAKAEEDEDRLERYFREETELGYPSPDRSPVLEQFARAAADRLRGADGAQRSERSQAMAEKLWESTPEQMAGALQAKFNACDNLNVYHAKITLIFDAPEVPGLLRQRQIITLKKGSQELSLYQFIQALEEDIALTNQMLEERDRELFENILTETVSHKLRARIAESQEWADNMTALMGSVDTSMGLIFRMDWKPKKAESPEEMDTAKLVSLLNRDKALLRPEDIQQVARHFRQKVSDARTQAANEDLVTNYGDLIRETLDYRNWYEFRLNFQRAGTAWKELTDNGYNQFSGGEKALSTYLPLFAAVSSQYKKASPDCPMMLAMDEAFAGVDDKNVGAMFELVDSLGFNYIMNSQSLWGTYETVSNLDIAELHRPANASVVTVLRYHWDGKRREEVKE